MATPGRKWVRPGSENNRVRERRRRTKRNISSSRRVIPDLIYFFLFFLLFFFLFFMVLQIRAKVSRDSTENGPANTAIYESEQVSLAFLGFLSWKSFASLEESSPFRVRVLSRPYLFKFRSLFCLVLARGSLSQWRHLERGKGGWLKTTFFFFFFLVLTFYKKFTFPFCFTTSTFASEEQKVNVDVKKLI